MSHGEVTFKAGTPEEYKVEIIEYLDHHFDGQVTQIAKLADGNHLVSFPGSDNKSQLLISQDLIAIICALKVYADLLGIDLVTEISAAAAAGKLAYACSNMNFKPTGGGKTI